MTATERIKALYREASKPLVLLLIIGVFVVIGYGLAQAALVSTTALGLLTSLASLVAGALIGFLFGIPRRIEGTAEPKPGYAVNTNLEQVSDWLTKAILGIGLVELGNLVTGFGNLSRTLGAALGGGGVGVAVAAAIIVVFVPLGFLSGYLWARTFFTGVLTDLDDIVGTRVLPPLSTLRENFQLKVGAVAEDVKQDGAGGGRLPENREPLVDVPAPVVEQVTDLSTLWHEIEAVLVRLAGSVGDEVHGTNGIIAVLQRRGVLDDPAAGALRQLSEANRELSAGAVLSEEDSAAVRVVGADTLAALARLRRFAPAAFEQHVLGRLRAGAAPNWAIRFDTELPGTGGRAFPIDAVVKRDDRLVGVEVKAQGPNTGAGWNNLFNWLEKMPEDVPVLLVVPNGAGSLRDWAAARGFGPLRILEWDTESDQLIGLVQDMLVPDA